MNIWKEGLEVRSEEVEGRAGKAGKAGKVPTLKYLVSQSLGGCFDPAEEEKSDRPEGSGDISSILSDHLRTPVDLDVSTLLSTAIRKGSELLQLGADMAYNMFGDELTAHKGNPGGPSSHIESVTKTATERTLASLFVGSSSDDDKSEQPKARVAGSKFVVQEADVGESDDTAYYNGYSFCVRGKGVFLDTVYVNGSGPLGKSLEIRIRLQRPLHDTKAFGNLVREHGPDQTLTFHYSHGFVHGCIDIICPPEIEIFKLTSIITPDGYIVVTAP